MATTRKKTARKATSAKRSSAKRAAAKRPAAKKSAVKRGTTKAAAKKAARKTSSTRASGGRSSTKSAAEKSTPKSASARKSLSTSVRGRDIAEYNRKRDFTKTHEPAGKVVARKRGALRFVIQKHAASHLHYDFRLELDGVMKSWAVPKGPSLDPSVRRLAMEVEDHPISYNTFEGTIPEGEYGGGTVMLWDRGTYEAEDGGGVESLREGYARGDLKFVMHGERLSGSFVLVRMKRPGRPQWLLIKHDDDAADRRRDITEEESTSVTTGRSMDEITEGAGGKRVWHSNR